MKRAPKKIAARRAIVLKATTRRVSARRKSSAVPAISRATSKGQSPGRRRTSLGVGASPEAAPTQGLPRPRRVRRGQESCVTPAMDAAAGEGAMFLVPPSLELPLADVISALRELHRERQDYHSAEKRMALQIKSIQRRTHARTCAKPVKGKANARKSCGCGTEVVYGELPLAALVLTEQRDALEAHRKRPEKEMQKLAKQLPVWAWWEATRGVGALGLAQIVAEAGDLAQYSNPAKLWKRMGLGLYQRTDGIWERQCKAAGDNGILAGYSPTRRSIMFVIGESIIKAGGPYRDFYNERKPLEAAKPACGKFKCKSENCQPGHVHNRAKRYMEKRLLRDLWRQWRAALQATSNVQLPATAPEVSA